MILNSIQHTARREHLCAFCGRTISVGERYVRDQAPGGGRLEKRAFHQGFYRGLVESADKTNNEIPRGK